MTEPVPSAAETLAAWRALTDRLEGASSRAGRSSPARLIAVTKTVPADRIAPLLEAGQVEFGENRVQEAKAKWPELRALAPVCRLHLIGPLQTNKVRDACALFDVIQTLDRPRLGEALRAEIDRAGRAPELLVQVNTGEEPQKAGILPAETDRFLDDMRGRLGLTVAGLMCIPPAAAPPGPHFALLAKMAARNGLPVLSMGMSADFETAIALGATHVRIGSALFGARPAPDPAPPGDEPRPAAPSAG
ncbi:MAG: YggS family pyridoxal phosphate-dependent enzyme [Alphaproteobacteria bacterium]|nr:YggS family pyridoxal phosphate-dependent enzyme [Alphaproteobacteria bacterium]